MTNSVGGLVGVRICGDPLRSSCFEARVAVGHFLNVNLSKPPTHESSKSTNQFSPTKQISPTPSPSCATYSNDLTLPYPLTKQLNYYIAVPNDHVLLLNASTKQFRGLFPVAEHPVRCI